jgi:hypothetical protein
VSWRHIFHIKQETLGLTQNSAPFPNKKARENWSFLGFLGIISYDETTKNTS